MMNPVMPMNRPTAPLCPTCGNDSCASRPRLLDEIVDALAALFGWQVLVFRCRYCLRRFRILVLRRAGQTCPACGRKLPRQNRGST
jgi:hypothetical protein